MPSSRSSSRRAQKPIPQPRKVNQVVLGNLSFKTWFDSLYPEDLVNKDTDTLFVCRWCFRYSCDRAAYTGHSGFCPYKANPPGTQIYNHAGYSIWEVDGEVYKLFAQNLSLFAKLFLDHKSIFFDVSSFLFYLLVFTNPCDSSDYHVLGYFSKEKMSWDPNNLACILIFPPFQHRQLGRFLMGISYKLSGWERGGTIGGPERPLSEMGKRSYVRFWEERLARYILFGPPGSQSPASAGRPVEHVSSKRSKKSHPREQSTVQGISQATGMLVEDVITTLESMGIVEEERPSKKQNRGAISSENEDGALTTIKKSDVLEWVKEHRVSLQDPVREEGFLGKWAGQADSEQSEDEDG